MSSSFEVMWSHAKLVARVMASEPEPVAGRDIAAGIIVYDAALQRQLRGLGIGSRTTPSGRMISARELGLDTRELGPVPTLRGLIAAGEVIESYGYAISVRVVSRKAKQ